LAIGLFMAATAPAQVVRIETTMGNIDMVLNPTHNTQLQGYVDNFLNYINNDRYLGALINRAADSNGKNFVLQMGGFFSNTKRPPLTIASTQSTTKFDPVKGVPASRLGLSNTIGTVALALPGNPAQIDQGTNEFFINADNNTFLDPSFTVFAQVSDMTVVNKIMDLATIDRTKDPVFSPNPQAAGAFSEVPVQSNGFQVFIKRAFVLSDNLSALKAVSDAQSLLADSTTNALPSEAILASDASLAAGSMSAASSAQVLLTGGVPEPSSMAMAAIGFGFYALRRRRR